jgi:hypothetical protein
MHRDTEKPASNAGARLIKNLRQLGFENRCLVFIRDKERTDTILQSELNTNELRFIEVTNATDDLTKFVNFQ